MTVYIHASLTAVPGRLDELGETVRWLATGMERRGMELLRAWRATDGPERMIDLWWVPTAGTFVDALTEARQHPTHGRAIDRLARSLADEVVRVLVPADHSPAPSLSSTADATYVQVVHTVEYGRNAEAWERLVPVGHELTEREGWRLAGAFDTAVGDLSEIFELWEAPPDHTGDLPAHLSEPDLAVHGITRRSEAVRLAPLEWTVRERAQR